MSGVLEVREPEPVRNVLCSVPTAVTRAADDVHRVVEIELCTQHVEVVPCPFHNDDVEPPEVEHFVEGVREQPPPGDDWLWLSQFMRPGGTGKGNSWAHDWRNPLRPPEGGMQWG